MKITNLKSNQKAYLVSINGDPLFVRRMYDLGFYPGCELRLRKRLGSKGAVVVSLKATSYSMRFEEAESIEVEIPEGSNV